MIIVTGRQLIDALDEKIIPSLMGEALKLHKVDFRLSSIIEFILEEECLKYIQSTLIWNPDTTLVLYVPNKDKKPKVVDEQDKIEKYFHDEVSQAEPTVLCFFFQNMTLEKLTKIFNQIFKMKAFT